MSTGKPAGKRLTGVTEVKLLLTAGTLAATLLGWAALAMRSEAAGRVEPKADGPAALPPSLAFLAEPLPTVVVPPQLADSLPAAVTPTGLRSVDAPPPVQIVTVNQPSSGGSGGSGSGRTASSR